MGHDSPVPSRPWRIGAGERTNEFLPRSLSEKRREVLRKFMRLLKGRGEDKETAPTPRLIVKETIEQVSHYGPSQH